TLGVAIIGSVFASLFGPGIRRALSPFLGHGLTITQLNAAQTSMQAAKSTVAHLPLSARRAIDDRVTTAFMNGLHRGCLVAAATAFVVAIIVFSYLPGYTRRGAHELVSGR
ncbi:MAG: hypothetical protein ABI298_09185, partial [Acidimicrobiales bacterium]